MNRDRVMVNSKGLLIKSNSIVYIACPGLIATGGPEALHQLGYELRRLGMHAYMYYVNSSPKTYPVHKNYEKYKNIKFHTAIVYMIMKIILLLFLKYMETY